MTHTHEQIENWIEDLVDEVRRDLVFLWSIARGSFGGLQVAPDRDTFEKVIGGLVTSGCLVGFGDPISSNWSVPTELQVPREQLPAAVIHFWEANRKENEFIAFALRERDGAEA